MKVFTNGQYRWLSHWLELPEKVQQEFDYVKEEDKTSLRFFEYQGQYYDTNEFMRVEGAMEDDLGEWDGSHHWTAFSGVLIKLDEDGEKVKVGRYIS